jgi:hypothetical protein
MFSECWYIRKAKLEKQKRLPFSDDPWILKSGIIGVYHHTSAKHLDRYVDEFSFRLNEGNVKNHTLTRLDSFVTGTKGKRLTYKGLIQ